jgi:hypothetical protein
LRRLRQARLCGGKKKRSVYSCHNSPKRGPVRASRISQENRKSVHIKPDMQTSLFLPHIFFCGHMSKRLTPNRTVPHKSKRNNCFPLPTASRPSKSHAALRAKGRFSRRGGGGGGGGGGRRRRRRRKAAAAAAAAEGGGGGGGGSSSAAPSSLVGDSTRVNEATLRGCPEAFAV